MCLLKVLTNNYQIKIKYTRLTAYTIQMMPHFTIQIIKCNLTNTFYYGISQLQIQMALESVLKELCMKKYISVPPQQTN